MCPHTPPVFREQGYTTTSGHAIDVTAWFPALQPRVVPAMPEIGLLWY